MKVIIEKFLNDPPVIYKHGLCELMEIINAIGEPGA